MKLNQDDFPIGSDFYRARKSLGSKREIFENFLKFLRLPKWQACQNGSARMTVSKWQVSKWQLPEWHAVKMADLPYRQCQNGSHSLRF